MARKTNKTAHVLSLLANGTAGEPDKEEDSSSLSPNISIVDNPTSTADPLAGLIHNTLSKEILKDGESEPENTADLNSHPSDEALVSPDMETEAPEEPKPAKKPRKKAKSKTAAEPSSDENEAIPEAESSAPQTISESSNEKTPDVPAETTPEASAETIPEASAGTTPEAFAKTTPEASAETTPEIAPETSAKATPEITPEASAKAAPEAEPVPPVSETAAEPVSPENQEATHTPSAAVPADTAQKEVDTDYIYLNMMDILVEERLMEFLQKFGVCTCKRCIVDAKALALSNLPPKYLVIPVASAAPLTSFYRNKYSIYIITELTKSCLAVLNNPRH